MLTDKDLMPWGKYKGIEMIKVPADYLIWLLDNGKCSGEVKTYIEENEKALRLEIDNK